MTDATPFLSTATAAAPSAPAAPAPTPTTTVAPASSSRPAGVGPFVSPGYKAYLLKQADSVRAAGGTDEDVKQYFQVALNKPGSAFPSATVDQLNPDQTPSNLRGISMALVQGATFGFGDEAIGSMLGLMTGMGARGGIDQYRREYADWYAQNHKTGLAAEIGGTAAAAVLTGGASAVAEAPGIVSAMGRAAVAGGAFGAAAGAGGVESDDLSWNMVGDRLKGAVMGAVVGATTAAGLAGAGTLVAPIAALAINKLGTTAVVQSAAKAVADIPVLGALQNITPEGRALELVSKFAKSRDLDAATLLQRAQGFWSQGQRPTIVDVMGPEFGEFARGVLKEQTGPVRQVIDELTQRQITSGDRLVGQLMLRSLDNPKLGTANVFDVAKELQNKARTEAGPLFEDAHQQTVPITPELRKQLQHPDVMAAWNAGARVANGEVETGLSKGLTVPTLEAPKPTTTSGGITEATIRAANPNIKQNVVDEIMRRAGVSEAGIARTAGLATTEASQFPSELPVRGFDYLKRSAQEPINARIKQVGMRETPQTQQLYDREVATMQARIAPIVDAARTAVPVFGQALDTYSGPMASRDAFLRGYKDFAKKVAPADVSSRINSIQPSDRDFYRLGAVKAHYEDFQKGGQPLANVAAQQFGGALLKFNTKTGDFIGRVNDDAARSVALFPGNPQGAQDFLRLVAGEADLSKTVNRALSLPKQVSTQKLIESDVGALPQARGTVRTAIAGAGRQALQQENLNISRADNQALAEVFGHGLKNPTDLRTLIEEIGYQQARSPWGVGAKLRTGVAAKVGQTAATAFIKP